MRRSAALLLIGLGLLAKGAPAFGQTPGVTLDAQQIYDRTRIVVAARTILPFIAYTQYAALVRHGNVKAEITRVVLRTADGKANITPLSVAPGEHVDARPTVKDRPLVYPTTSFGLVKRHSGESASTYESASAPEPESNGPRVIGRVASLSRDYAPTLIATETLDGAPVYHLKLVPRFDPQHHPIRDLYVDTTTFDPRRIAIEVWARVGPIRSRPTVNVDYAPVEGTWMVTHAAMDFVMRLAFFRYGGSGEFRTSDVSFPATEPDWLFDSAALSAHLNAAPPAQPR